MFLPQKFDGINGDRPGPALHFLPGPCQVAELFPSHLQGRIHGRHLKGISQKGKDRFAYLRRGYQNLPFFQNPAGNILGIRCDAQPEISHIFLLPVREHIAELRCISKTYRKNPHRVRVKGSCMSDLFLFTNTAESCHHIMRSAARLLIYVQNPMVHFYTRAPSNFREFPNSPASSARQSGPKDC